MSRVLLVAGVVLALTAGDGRAGDPPNVDAGAKELEKFQGTWMVVSAVTGGQPLPEKLVEATKVEIKDGTMTVLIGGKKGHRQKFTIDPAKNPKHIDMTRQFEDRKDTLPGIYMLDGDTLKLCADDNGRDRPTAFKTTKDTPSHSLLILKRAKP